MRSSAAVARRAPKAPSARPRAGGPPEAQALSQRVRAYQGFTHQIISGGIHSGQFISQRELMTLLDMPLGAVREMIPRLEAGGLIRTVPQRGLQIAAAHQDILRRAAAPHPDATLLDDAQALDWGLHDRMVDALGNDIVSEMYRVNSLRVRLIKLEHSVITPTRLMPAMQEHLRFITALQARDADAATALLHAHIQSARDRVLTAPLEQVRAEWTPNPATLKRTSLAS